MSTLSADVPVWSMSIVFRPLVKPYVQPRNTTSSGAEPNRRRPKVCFHHLADKCPQRMLLESGALRQTCKVSINRQVADRTRNDESRIFAQVGKGHDTLIGKRLDEVICKCTGIQFSRQVRTVQQYELERPIDSGRSDRRCLHRNAEKGASASSAMKNERNSASLCHAGGLPQRASATSRDRQAFFECARWRSVRGELTT